MFCGAFFISICCWPGLVTGSMPKPPITAVRVYTWRAFQNSTQLDISLAPNKKVTSTGDVASASPAQVRWSTYSLVRKRAYILALRIPSDPLSLPGTSKGCSNLTSSTSCWYEWCNAEQDLSSRFQCLSVRYDLFAYPYIWYVFAYIFPIFYTPDLQSITSLYFATYQ